MAKLTTKRQVTLPQSVCTKLGLSPGDSVQVFERDGVAHLVKMTEDDLAGCLSCKSADAIVLEPTKLKRAIKEKASSKYRGQE